MNRLGEATRLYMASKRYTTREVGNAVGVSHSTVARFLSGKDVSQHHFLAILNWLMKEEL